ncbi:hypothetical protein BCR42DRAFT_407936 [Absidia repens]|uniref:Uncharacterized protein n=1 Tax=Absidia repens TaxID=90262 RepID=A0A1X2ISU4_9FUNG|nr:hypothetical protein BCR42DRAFT_407936 [Absidia repens]
MSFLVLFQLLHPLYKAQQLYLIPSFLLFYHSSDPSFVLLYSFFLGGEFTSIKANLTMYIFYRFCLLMYYI